MTIADAREKCKTALAAAPKDALLVGILVLASSASFGLGFLAGRDAGQGISSADSPQGGIVIASTTGQIVASKGGTKYYLPSCPGAARISDANKVWFASASAAEAAGYSRAANCKNP